ncbi:hypothetical protein WA171_004817 [Blastocystis sp. BT1]
MATKAATRTLVNLADIPAFGTSKLASVLSLWQGDITSLKVQCIVNDVNSDFSKPKGVTNVINKYGGHGIVNDYSRLKKCSVGSAVIGSGFALPCDYVIHAASPNVSYKHYRPTEEEERLLKDCYTAVMNLCMSKDIHSIAFPCLATRAHRYPIEDASKVEVRTIVQILKEHDYPFERVILCTHKDSDTEVMKKALEECLKEME